MCKKNIRKWLSIAAVFALAGTMLAGCGNEQDGSGESAIEAEQLPSQEIQSVDITALTTPGVNVDLTGEYSQEEIAGTWDSAQATKIQLQGQTYAAEGENAANLESQDGKMIIKAAGTYVLSGEGNMQIVVDAAEEEQVQLVLNGVTLCNDATAPMNIISGDCVMLTLAEGTENQVQDQRAAYVEDETEAAAKSEDELIEGAIYSEVDLVINGSGKLTVEAGFDDAIRTKDDLKLISGSYHVTSQDDAFVGKDSISICGGNYVVDALGAAFKSNKEDDLEKGFVVVDGGTFDLTAVEGDGFHGEFVLVINAGDILIREAEEGLEAMNIIINGGNIELTATDDGVNISEAENYTDTFGVEWAEEIAAQSQVAKADGAEIPEMPESAEPPEMPEGMEMPEGAEPPEMPEGMEMPEGTEPPEMPEGMEMPEMAQDTAVDHIPGALIINGGTLKVTASGDGLDSNGDILITGGTTIVCGPTSADNGSLDYADTFNMTGGTLVVSGNRGMEQSISSETIPVVTVNYSEQQSAGTEVVVADDSGKELFRFTAEHDFSYVAYASAELTVDKTYSVTAGSVKEDGAAAISQSMMMMRPGGGMGGKGQMPVKQPTEGNN